MTDSASVILWIVGLYAGAGVFVALGFAAIAAPRLIGPHGTDTSPHRPMTLGARLLLIPGAIIFWALVLKRWLAEPL
jgi:hypothetical protein